MAGGSTGLYEVEASKWPKACAIDILLGPKLDIKQKLGALGQGHHKKF